ncbi:hypothetical protein CYPRO_0014 [Cyclonatronum proteinivorum]|uniref:YbbR-like protein n=1 Tax=Cyclonatronum proteinivorum TaxID=1457365 RepID=A0A345UFQ1_9BACT|nr:hypothetical protein [Cyclonatronum proteinivorum]AXI99302.1 hypothetical protein CYPRO_0014 [Cyclonatronum proteinivorum]
MPGFFSFVVSLWERVKAASASRGVSSSANMQRTEKVLVFFVAYSIALGLWLLINLSRDFSFTQHIPLYYGAFPEDKAPVQSLPESVRATFTGEGWKLLGLSRNTQRLAVDVNETTTDLTGLIEQQITATSDIGLSRVEPARITLQLEEALTRKIPVVPNIELQTRRQFGLSRPPVISPDSVTISGARSLIQNIDSWPTESKVFRDLQAPVQASIPLQDSGELIRLSDTEVRLSASVVEFTEGETRVPVEITEGSNRPGIILSPSVLTVRYNVPVSEYAEVNRRQLFRAVIPYQEILADTTGFLHPQLIADDSEFAVSIRSAVPRRVSYFILIDE